MKRLLGVGVLFLAVAFALTACEAVPLTAGTRVVTGGNFVLNSGETHNGGLLVLGGNSLLQSGSRNIGDVTVLGGNTDALGEIDGNISIIGGNVTLGPTAVVRGNISLSGGNLNRAPTAQVTGNVNMNAWEVPAFGSYFEVTPLSQLSWLLFRALLIAGLAMLAVALMPEPVARLTHAIADQPLMTGLVGFVAMLAIPALAILLALTILLIPVSLLLGLALAIMAAFGWIALGVETGRRLTEWLKWPMQPVWQAALGTLAFTMVVGLIEFMPIVGGLTVFVATVIAVGAVVITRFGTRAYTPPPANLSMPPTTRPAGMTG
jgi:hypothetical protein